MIAIDLGPKEKASAAARERFERARRRAVAAVGWDFLRGAVSDADLRDRLALVADLCAEAADAGNEAVRLWEETDWAVLSAGEPSA